MINKQFSCQKSPEIKENYDFNFVAEPLKDDVLFDFVNEPSSSHGSSSKGPSQIVPYNFADRQLRHSNQSGKRFIYF